MIPFVDLGQGRPALLAKASAVSAIGHLITGNERFSAQPFKGRHRAEQVGGMRRAACLATAAAMTKEKVLDLPMNGKSDVAAQATSFVFLRHLIAFWPLCKRVGLCELSSALQNRI